MIKKTSWVSRHSNAIRLLSIESIVINLPGLVEVRLDQDLGPKALGLIEWMRDGIRSKSLGRFIHLFSQVAEQRVIKRRRVLPLGEEELVQSARYLRPQGLDVDIRVRADHGKAQTQNLNQ